MPKYRRPLPDSYIQIAGRCILRYAGREGKEGSFIQNLSWHLPPFRLSSVSLCHGPTFLVSESVCSLLHKQENTVYKTPEFLQKVRSRRPAMRTAHSKLASPPEDYSCPHLIPPSGAIHQQQPAPRKFLSSPNPPPDATHLSHLDCSAISWLRDELTVQPHSQNPPYMCRRCCLPAPLPHSSPSPPTFQPDTDYWIQSRFGQRHPLSPASSCKHQPAYVPTHHRLLFLIATRTMSTHLL